MGYISHTSLGVAGGTAGLTLNEPAGSANQDIYAFCYTNNVLSTWTPPAGYTAIDTDASIGSAVFRKTDSGAGGGSVTFTRATSTSGAGGVILVRWSGGGTPTAADLTSGTLTTHTLASVTNVSGNSSLQIVARVTTGGTAVTAPGNGSGTPGNPVQRTATGATTSGASAMLFGIGDEAAVTANPTGTRVWGVSSGPTRGVHITIPSSAVPPKQGSASGGYAFAGSATGQRKSAGTAAGGYAFAGSAAGEAPRQGSAQGGYNFAGVAIGHEPGAPSIGFTEGGYDFSGSAAGEAVRQGSAEGGYDFSGTAEGHDPENPNPYRFCTGCRPRSRRRRRR